MKHSFFIVIIATAAALGTTSAGPPRHPSAMMDGAWKASTLEITDGKRDFRVAVRGANMVIKDGEGTWTDGSNHGTVKIELSGFASASLGFASAPIDFTYVEGTKKGVTWQGICSRCGSSAIVCVSTKGRPEEFAGSEALPVMIFHYRLERRTTASVKPSHAQVGDR